VEEMQAKKEISIAIVIGLVIGGVIIGGIYRAKTAIDKHLSSALPAATATPTSETQENPGLPLNITTPIDGSVTDTAKLELSGNTLKDTYITILTEKNEYIIVPSDTGNFSQEITLIKGANTIIVTVYTQDGNKTEKTLNLVYTTADL